LGTPKPHSEHETVVDPKEAFRSIKRIFTRKNSLIFLGVYLAVVGVHELFIELTLEKKMIELSITPFGRGIIIAGIKVLALVVLQGILFKKLKSVRSKAVLAFSSMIIAFPIIGFTSTIAVYLPFYFLTNAATMIRDAYLSPIMQKLSSNRTRATDISMYALVGRIPFAIIAPAATSYLVSHNTRVLFAISALSIILVTPPLFKILAWYDQQTLPN